SRLRGSGLPMREAEVKRRLAEQLRAEGFLNLRVRYGQEPGIDIEAQFPDSRRWLYIEVKGTRPGGHETASRRAALGEALWQIFSVYDGMAVCAIALPDTRGFRKLVQQILTPLSQLCLHILYVGEDEMWHQAPNELLPRRIASLKEALSRD
ncbi:MAG: hypothetical protein NZ941_02600, partial [Candidatus Caldarchaeum sp.]|nr:hypothetical protein [Candidatus Caldarchaeum sp.]